MNVSNIPIHQILCLDGATFADLQSISKWALLLTTRKHTMTVAPYSSFLAALMKIVSERDALEEAFEIESTSEIDTLESSLGKRFHVEASTYHVRRDVSISSMGNILGYIRSYIDADDAVVTVRAYY